jgi:hypothetical protein
MPVRQSRDKKVMGGPQGEDAYIVLKRLTVDEAYQFNKQLTEWASEALAGSSEPDEREQEARKLYADMILDWNWVDSDDKPLPKPNGNPDVIGQLWSEELNWISLAILGQTPEQQKDAKKKSK